MLKLKKIWIFLLGIIAVFWFNFHYAQGLDTRDHNKNNFSQEIIRNTDPKINEEEIAKQDPTWQWIKVMWDKSKWILHLPQSDNYETELWYLLALIQIAVNWILWMLAFIALVYMLYCWFLVLSSWSDDKTASKWKDWIKSAVIAIAWIWIAWLIVSAMIWFIQLITNTNR